MDDDPEEDVDLLNTRNPWGFLVGAPFDVLG